ncbi:hypothetical protein BMF89_17925 [Arthrobacter sp. SRS-W-1-2016]|nr:hypothetical protein BMF89_17925 [Arthrobacter sp. SRS-W-1-2016]
MLGLAADVVAGDDGDGAVGTSSEAPDCAGAATVISSTKDSAAPARAKGERRAVSALVLFIFNSGKVPLN